MVDIGVELETGFDFGFENVNMIFDGFNWRAVANYFKVNVQNYSTMRARLKVSQLVKLPHFHTFP